MYMFRCPQFYLLLIRYMYLWSVILSHFIHKQITDQIILHTISPTFYFFTFLFQKFTKLMRNCKHLLRTKSATKKQRTNAWQKYRDPTGFETRTPGQKATKLKRILPNAVVRCCSYIRINPYKMESSPITQHTS